MSERLNELAERQRALQKRCAEQRLAIAEEARAIEERFAAVDRVAAYARSTVLHPAAVAAGAVALLTVGRVRSLQLVTRAVLLGAAVRRLVQAVRQL